jgi:hypothetical protein
MSVFSKKDDVEIILSHEDADKLVGENSDDNFEINFIIVDLG